VSLEASPDGQDGAFDLGRDPLGGMVGPGQVVEAVHAELEVATPPLVEPELGAAQRLADVLSRLPKVISHRRRKSLENKAFSEKSLSLIVS
jgi:hypothetical protein